MNREERNEMPMTPGTPDARMGNPPCAPGDTDSGIGNNLSLAMVYSPKQYWRNLFDTDRALQEGTLFRELDFPFRGEKMGDTE